MLALPAFYAGSKKVVFLLPYYSFHETPGDIVHTLLTAFPLLLFLCYPFPSPRHSSPGGNTQKSYICKGCQSWLLDNCPRARGPSPAFQVARFKLFPQGTDPPGSALVFHSRELHCSGHTRCLRPFLASAATTPTGRATLPHAGLHSRAI